MVLESPKNYESRAVVISREEIVNYVNRNNADQFIIAPYDIEGDSDFNLSVIRYAKVISRKAEMLESAKQKVMRSTTWITGNDLKIIYAATLDDCAVNLDSWIDNGLIFSIEIDEKRFFPFYALDPLQKFFPYKILAEILKVFGGSKTGWGVAIWFSSISGFLGSQSPQTLLSSNPDWVLAAAKDEMLGIIHG